MSGADDDMKKKLLYIEFLRAIAVLFVIFNHTGGDGFRLFLKYPAGSIQYWTCLSVSIFCKFAVPVFFMISGALLLGKDEPLKVLWKKRIARMAIVLVTVSLMYYFAECLLIGPTPFEGFLRRLYGSAIKTHLWFLYLYIAFLMTLPFLRMMVQKMEVKHFYYLIGLAVLFAILSYIGLGTEWPEVYYKLKPAWVLSAIVLYPCVGYFLEQRVDERCYSVKQLVILWAANISTIAITGALIMRIGEGDDRYDIFGLINSICVFYTAKLLFMKWHPGKVVKWIINALGSSAFGVYLIHVGLLSGRLKQIVFDSMIGVGVNSMAACWAWCLVVYLICMVVVWLVRRLAFMRKYI